MDQAPALRPLAGGFSGETFLAESAGERTVVRIYGQRSAWRGPEAPEIDAALLTLVRGLLPVPEVLEVRRADPAARTPGLLVTSLVPGTTLQQLWDDGLDDGAVARVGTGLGVLLARLAQMPMLRAGTFTDGDLRVGSFPEGEAGLVGFVEGRRAQGALASWPEEDVRRLLEVADRADGLADEVGRRCLVHSDFNPKNLMVEPATLAVTGVLDWEFAHAGSPYTDLGNLLRFHRHPAFADAVLATYAERVPDVPDNLLDQARAADLWALVDLAAREQRNPVADDATRLLHAIARTGDLHAR